MNFYSLFLIYVYIYIDILVVMAQFGQKRLSIHVLSLNCVIKLILSNTFSDNLCFIFSIVERQLSILRYFGKK